MKNTTGQTYSEPDGGMQLTAKKKNPTYGPQLDKLVNRESKMSGMVRA